MKNYILTFLLLSGIFTGISAQKADRGQYPKAGDPQDLELPELQSFSLANGLPVHLVEKRNLPLLQFILVFDAGSIDDPAEKLGLAAMTAEMMDEGAGERNALELSEEIDFLGITLNAYANREQTGLRLFTPVSRLDKALPLFADVLLRPRFDPVELDRKRTEALVGLTQARDEPDAIAGEAFNQLVFGKNHPYGQTLDGNEASLKSMTVEDLKRFQGEFIRPGNGFLVVVGDISRAELEEKLNPLFTGWSGGAKRMRKMPAAPMPDGFQIFLIDKPGAAQSVLRFGHPGLSRNNPDEYAVEVLNTILGGSFTSRLNQNIREQHGYSYGARSRFWQPRAPGYFVAYANVQTDVTAPAISEFLKELNAIRDVSPEEVEKSRNYLALGFPGEFQRIESIAAKIADGIFYNLPDDYLNRYIDNILAITEQQIETAARNHIQPEKTALIIVGDRAKIEAGIAELNLGEIKYLSIEDVLGPAPVVGGMKE